MNSSNGAMPNLGYLIHHLAFALDRQSDQVLQERLGIGFSQFKILMAAKWKGSVQQKRIAKYLSQTEASVSRQVKILQEKGFVESKPNPKSRREKITVLTLKGERILERAMLVLNEHHSPMMEQLSPKQQIQFIDSIKILRNFACGNYKDGNVYD